MQRGWSAFNEPPKPPPEPPQPKPGKGKNIRVRVEGAGKNAAINKLMTTTEALTAEERQIVRGYRLSVGGEAERKERMRLELDILKEKD